MVKRPSKSDLLPGRAPGTTASQRAWIWARRLLIGVAVLFLGLILFAAYLWFFVKVKVTPRPATAPRIEGPINPCLDAAQYAEMNAALRNVQPVHTPGIKERTDTWISEKPIKDTPHWYWGRIADADTGYVIYEGRYTAFPPGRAGSSPPAVPRVRIAGRDTVWLEDGRMLFAVDSIWGHNRENPDVRACKRPNELPRTGVPEAAIPLVGVFEEPLFVHPTRFPETPDRVWLETFDMDEIRSGYRETAGPEPFVALPPSGERVTSADLRGAVSVQNFRQIILGDGRILVSEEWAKEICRRLEASEGKPEDRREQSAYSVAALFCGRNLF